MLVFFIYFIGIIDNLIKLFIILGIFGCVFGILGFILSPLFFHDFEEALSNYKITPETMRNFLKKMFISGIVCIFLATITPNSKTLAAMYLVPAVVNNEKLQNITGNSLSALEELTRQWVEDLAKNKNIQQPTQNYNSNNSNNI